MSELKVNKISPRSGTDVTLGDSGDTITIPSGATITNSGTATGFGGTNTPAFQVNLSADQTISDNVNTKIQFDREVFDTDNAFDSTTNYRFTVPSGQDGKYFIYLNALCTAASTSDADQIFASISVNGTTRAEMCGADFRGNPGTKATVNATLTLNLSASDYVEAFARINSQTTAVSVSSGGTSRPDETSFGGYKIIE